MQYISAAGQSFLRSQSLKSYDSGSGLLFTFQEAQQTVILQISEYSRDLHRKSKSITKSVSK